jgi:signal transduction histidine kinase
LDEIRHYQPNLFLDHESIPDKASTFETSLQHKNGEIIPVRISVSTCSVADDPKKKILLIQDMSEEAHREKLRNIIIEIANLTNQNKPLIPILEDVMFTLTHYLELPLAFICLSHDGVTYQIEASDGLLPCGKEAKCNPSDSIITPGNLGCREVCQDMVISSEPLEEHNIFKCVDPDVLTEKNYTLVHVPLCIDINVVGLIHFAIPDKLRKLYLEESQVISLIANKLSSSITNKKLEEELHDYADNLERIVQDRTIQLREKDAQLVQSGKLATLGEMATGIAHEINQPLGGISLMTQGLQKAIEKGKLTDEILKNRLLQINEQIERINKIITHLRIFGRQAPESRTPVNILKPIIDVFDLIGQQIEKRNIEVITNYDENLPLISADNNRLEQVFLNLIGNARDALEEQEERVKTLLESENPPEWVAKWVKQISVHVYHENDTVIAKVSDTAGGIPEKIREKIFEPFFTTKQVGKGTGLGLSISYGIVKEFDGEILLSTVVDQGTTFTLTFPALKQL